MTSSEFRAWLATQKGAGAIPALARAVARGETWRLDRQSSFHDDQTRGVLTSALAEWSRSRTPAGQASTSTGRRRTVSLRSAGGGQGQKRRLRSSVRATPGKGAGTGQAVVSTFNLAYEIGFGWTELILPGAFTESIAAHPVIPIYQNHDWSNPIGSGRPSEDPNGGRLVVDFRLYVEMGDLVARVYQAMQDGALVEWSIGFWAEVVTSDAKNPMCDQIARGDLAEASICVRGANPETGTLELAGHTGWLMGTEQERRREVERVRRAMGQLAGAR